MRDAMTTTLADDGLDQLIAELEGIRSELLLAVTGSRFDLQRVHPGFRESAGNLLQYLAMRRRDLRPLQSRLAELGLSSLGRSESHVLASIDTVLSTLYKLADRQSPPELALAGYEGFQRGARLLHEHTEQLLGPMPEGRGVHIMVTMPGEAATDPKLVLDLLQNGMTCMRINCAHDDVVAWSRMIENLRAAEERVGRQCKVSMDLAGPKLRTGPVTPGPAVIKVRPGRDVWGKVTAPARLWLASGAGNLQPPSPADACIALPPDRVAELRTGDRITLTDTRGARRNLAVVDTTPAGCWLESQKTLYLSADTRLHCRAKGKWPGGVAIQSIPPRDEGIRLRPGDLLVLGADTVPGRPATRDSAGRLLTPARIGCTLPAVLAQVRAGEEVWFDDGRIGGVVEGKCDDDLQIRITNAQESGATLRGDKGINFPNSELHLPALTEKDLADLRFASQHADIIALSFANNVDDVRGLISCLRDEHNGKAGIVLKIETVAGFRQLPAMLLEAMSMPSCGVMIARGDLAVEIGFGRLAEVQEEILWLCEAAHVPVIWATQVLENVAKHGAPTRAEITDAAMSHRAECVMLNKGPHIIKAIRILDDILRRMQGHQVKKQAMLRELSLAGAYRPVP